MTNEKPPQGASAFDVLRQPFLYFRQYRNLRLEQVLARLRNRFPRRLPRARPTPPLRKPSGLWDTPPGRPALMLSGSGFRIANRELELSFPQGWSDSRLGPNGLRELHSFFDLTAIGWREREAWQRALVERWIADNAPGEGSGWRPYVVSVRLVNWIRWSLAGNELEPEMLESLATQARFVEGRLEWDLLGNHLLANAKALVFAGFFFEGTEAERWADLGLQVLDHQIPEQILADGGHHERSPMYHALVLEDLLDLINLHKTYARSEPATWQSTALSMRYWLRAMTHPDGEISLFNDSAKSRALRPADIEDYAKRLGSPSLSTERALEHLAATGYARLSGGRAVVLLDLAPLGPRHLSGHGHADTLTFELSLDGSRLIVDRGVSTYRDSVERSDERGTSAHNTAVIDGHNSSEVWDAFRVGARANVTGASVETLPECAEATGCHDGYMRLPGVGQHCRIWRLDDRGLEIVDTVEGRDRHKVEFCFHFHPDVGIEIGEDRVVVLRRSDMRPLASVAFDERLEVRTIASSYHPEFGLSLPCQKLVAAFEGPLSARFRHTFRWS